MHFLVFVPNCKPADLEATAKVAGLTPILDGHDAAPCENGPSETSGLMIGCRTPQSPYFHYAPAEQDWVPSVCKDEHGKPRYWVGFWKEKPPTESELRRHYTQSGQLVKFGESRWKLATPDTVDARAVYADDGSMRWEVIRKFSWMCDEAKALNATYLEEFGMRKIIFHAEPSAQVGWLLKLLQVNYRMLPEVATYLDLWIGKDHILDTFLMTLGLKRREDGDD